MKMKKIMPIILIVALVGGASAAGSFFYSQEQSKKKVDESQNQIKEKEQKIKDLEKEIKEQETSEDTSKKGTGTKKQIVSPKGFFKIDLPQSGDSITSPVRIKGWANVFEAQFQARVKDASGNVLGSKSVTASEGAPNGGTFDTTITFTAPATTQEGVVEIYDLSQIDGSIDDIAKIPVTIRGR